ncbi:hypothetical protein [Stenotrophomonas maltophilia]|uniref:hypothetical protein n=1 Tax=Stenotrophomonas maltophilia TaxID=40324 RepID=UPI003D7CC5D2
MGRAHVADYLAKDLAERGVLPTLGGLAPYAVDRPRVARDVGEVAPEWYVMRDGDGRVRTYITCDPWEHMPDRSLMAGGKPVQSSEDRVSMCPHSIVDVAGGMAVKMSYTQVLLVDWQQLEVTASQADAQQEIYDITQS